MKQLLKLPLLLGIALVSVLSAFPTPASAAAGTCTPSGDYGSATQNVTIGAGGTYTVWSRMATDNAANKSYMLQIDNAYCFTVGSSSAKTVPVYASGDTTRFNGDSSNWLKTDTNGATVSVPNLTAGTHQIKLIGNAPNVVLDRLIFTQDTNCTPTGTGDNCAIPPDTTPPSVNITAPANNATVSSTTNITANASDDVSVASVEFYVDGALRGTDTSAPYSYSFNPTSVAAGSHRLTAKAIDTAGNATTSAVIQVTVPDSVKPTVTITSPSANATISGTASFTATASDNGTIQKVDFYADNENNSLGSDTSAANSSYGVSVDTTKLSNGAHTLIAKATDNSGNTTSSTVAVTVSNTTTGADTTAPAVTIGGLTSGAFVNMNSKGKPYDSSKYGVSAVASDASGIKQVVFKMNNATTATLGTAPFGSTVNLNNLACGNNTLTATAVDNSSAQNNKTASVTFFATYAEDVVPQAGCKVDYLDLSALAGKYGQSGSAVGRADINGDGKVDFLDLSALAGRYGK